MHGTPCKPVDECADCRSLKDIDGILAAEVKALHARTFTPGLKGAAAEHRERWSAGNRSPSFLLAGRPNNAG